MRIYDIQSKYQVAGYADIKSITNGADAATYLKGAYDDSPEQEQFFIIPLNAANKPLGRLRVSLGLVNQTIIHPREAFRVAIREGATGVILSHNHPSGESLPSPEDIATTKRLVEAGKLLDIPVYDHLIIGDSWHSLRASHPQIFT